MEFLDFDGLSHFLTKLKEIFEPKLTWDSAPTSGSTNPVTSGGVYDAMKNGLTTSIQNAAGSDTYIEVETEDLYIGGTEPTDSNTIWVELKEE